MMYVGPDANVKMDGVLIKCGLESSQDLDFVCPRNIRDEIAGELVDNSGWYLVGRTLNVSDKKLNSIRDDHVNRPSSIHKAVDALDAWSVEHGSEATCLKLAEALYDHKMISTLEVLCREVKPSLKVKSRELATKTGPRNQKQQAGSLDIESWGFSKKQKRSRPNDWDEESVACVDPCLLETVTIKPCGKFPYLKLESISKVEEERIHQTLFAESARMIEEFNNLFKTTRESLIKGKILVKDLLKHLDCLGSIQPMFKGSTLPVLGCQLPELRKLENIDDAMSVISDYCSFFNYHIVEEIINNLGTEQDKTNLEKYQEKFSEYAQRHVFECPSELGEMNEVGHANMFVTLDVTYESYTVSHLYAFVSKLQRILKKAPPVTLRLCRIGPGSLKMIFQLPLSIQQVVFPLSLEQEEALSGLGVVQLSCGDYRFTRLRNEETENTTTFSSSEDTSIAEVNFLDAKLTATKLEDDLSIADSALGMSSVASVTTAGVTQFSEDLIDRELDDLNCHFETAVETGHSDENKLCRASHRGDIEEVKRLVEENHLNPLDKDKNGANALHHAAINGQLEVLIYFTKERGCNPATEDSKGLTCLHVAAQFNHYDVVQYLIDELKIDPMCQTTLGNTPLHRACVGGSTAIVAYLINSMSNYLPIEAVLRCKGQYGWSPLHFAAYYGKLEIVMLLTEQFNSDPLMTSDKGRIALHWAAQQGHLHIVKFLVGEMKCDPSYTDKDKVTPLHYATFNGHLDIIKYLTLEQKCDPLCVDKNKNTPLYWAVIEGKLEVVKFFIEALQCSRKIRGQKKNTLIKMARRRGHHHVVEYLESIRK